MGIVTAQELKDYVNGPDLRGDDTQSLPWSAIGRDAPSGYRPAPITLEQAQDMLSTLEDDIIHGRFPMWKALRPWNIVDLRSGLDEDAPWIGWEVETSWDSIEDRGAAVSRFFDTYNHVAVDEEGGDSYMSFGLEMTWSPASGGRYDGLHPLLFVAELGQTVGAFEHEPEDMVGTHINISTPSVRACGHIKLRRVANALNLALCEINSTPVCESIFGRFDLYGGFFLRGGYLEGKLFNTTYCTDQALHYIAVGDRLANVVEALAAHELNAPSKDLKLRVEGLETYLLGEAPSFRIWVAEESRQAYPDELTYIPEPLDEEEEY